MATTMPLATKTLRLSTSAMAEYVIDALARRGIVAAVAYLPDDGDERYYVVEWHELQQGEAAPPIEVSQIPATD